MSPGQFDVLPDIAPDGTLTFTPNADATGVAQVQVRLEDGGGTQFGDVDMTAPQTFEIILGPLSIPTLGEYALIALALLMALVGTIAIRRNPRRELET